MSKPRVLLLDIETAPMVFYTWSMFDVNLGLNQMVQDWSILSWAAIWLDDPDSKIMYMDVSKEKNVRNDKKLLKPIRDLMDEADIIVGQNSDRFDIKKLKARFIQNGIKPPSPSRTIDTLKVSKKHFAFTSHKLEYMTKNLCTEYTKLAHKEFPGQELWNHCLLGNKRAWKEMELYNKHDVLSLRELFLILQPWGTGIDFNVYTEKNEVTCNCGSSKLQKRGFNFTNKAKYQRFQCVACGAWSQGTTNLLSKEKKLSLRNRK